MYVVIERQTSVLRAIAMLVAFAMMLWGLGFHMFTKKAQADDLFQFSDTLSNSHPGSGSDHQIDFTIPSGMATGENFTVAFDSLFDTASIVIGDIDLLIDGNGTTTNDGAAGAGAWGVTGLGTDNITFTTPTDGGVGSSTVVQILIGTNATGGTNQILNPTATTSYEVVVSGTMLDSGRTRVAIIDNVLMTATVNTSLRFQVFGVNEGETVNSSPTTTTATTTNILLPFGVLQSGTSKTLAQDLEVETNAANGYAVTIHQDNNLQSGTGADIDGFIDGNYTNTPTGWTSPSNNIANERTWGHWGLTSDDATTTRAAEFGADEWISATGTPRIVMSHDLPSDGQSQGSGAARIGFQVQITSLQEAGDDYNTTLTYVATPVF